MELDLWALLAVGVGIVPGIPGELFYRLIAGATWREDAWSRVFRIVGFSLAGLVLAILTFRFAGIGVVATLCGAIIEQTFSESVVLGVAALLAGQTIASTVVGLGSGYSVRGLCHVFHMTPYADGWDEYVRRFVPNHWVIVRLLDGSSFAGILSRADTTVPPENRDIILSEPAIFDEEEGNYLSVDHQYLFLPGASIASVAVVHDPEKDTRISQAGTVLFWKEPTNEQGKEPTETPSASAPD
jgi:hypothetical protein